MTVLSWQYFKHNASLCAKFFIVFMLQGIKQCILVFWGDTRQIVASRTDELQYIESCCFTNGWSLFIAGVWGRRVEYTNFFVSENNSPSNPSRISSLCCLLTDIISFFTCMYSSILFIFISFLIMPNFQDIWSLGNNRDQTNSYLITVGVPFRFACCVKLLHNNVQVSFTLHITAPLFFLLLLQNTFHGSLTRRLREQYLRSVYLIFLSLLT